MCLPFAYVWKVNGMYRSCAFIFSPRKETKPSCNLHISAIRFEKFSVLWIWAFVEKRSDDRATAKLAFVSRPIWGLYTRQKYKKTTTKDRCHIKIVKFREKENIITNVSKITTKKVLRWVKCMTYFLPWVIWKVLRISQHLTNFSLKYSLQKEQWCSERF